MSKTVKEITKLLKDELALTRRLYKKNLRNEQLEEALKDQASIGCFEWVLEYILDMGMEE